MDSLLWLSAAVSTLPSENALRLIDGTKRQLDAREQTRRAKEVTRAYFRRLAREGVALDLSRADVPSIREAAFWRWLRRPGPFGPSQWAAETDYRA